MQSTTQGELTTVADDEIVIHRGASVERVGDLRPDTVVEFGGFETRTLPRKGELLATFATVNDLHFGESIGPEMPTELRPAPDDRPYPEFMNEGAVREISRIDPAAVVVKGDLTSNGTMAEFKQFLQVYDGAFGDRLLYIRGNHESYNYFDEGNMPFQERNLEGVTIALLDTSRDGQINGSLSQDQLEFLDELGSRADRPVMVFGHHPIWNESVEPRSDDTFGLVPDATEQLIEVLKRRPRMVGYFAGHTHRNGRTVVGSAPDKVFAEVACVKDYPGTWAEYRVFEGNILQVHRRISTPEALNWSERARHMFEGFYGEYAFGKLEERCFEIPVPDWHL